jgi:hypothetical protein
VESIWQGLKFPDERDRRRVAELDGPQARAEGEKQGYGATICYGGEDIVVGTSAHWRLMEKACRAKFEQNAEARAALLATGERPLTHVVPRQHHHTGCHHGPNLDADSQAHKECRAPTVDFRCTLGEHVAARRLPVMAAYEASSEFAASACTL